MWKAEQYCQEVLEVLHVAIPRLKKSNHEVNEVYQKHSGRIHHANQLQKITVSEITSIP